MDVSYIAPVSLIVAFFNTLGSCFPTGAPLCLMDHPHHNNINSQTGVSPFTITLSSQTYNPKQNISIVVSATDGRVLIGILLTAHRTPTSNNTEEFIGEFVTYPDDKLKVLDCLAGTQKPLTHKNRNPVTSLNITWRAPEGNVGDVVFQATIVENFTTFWYGVKQQLSAASTTDIVPPPYTFPPVKTMFAPINWPACGKTKGCFLFPDTCSGLDCMAAVTYTMNGANYTFEMFAIAQGYVALGFSEDKTMGDDDTMACVSDGNRLNIQHGYNPPGKSKYNLRQYTKDLQNVEAKLEDGKIFCRFTRPRQNSVIDRNGAVKQIDMAGSWYLLMAWGHTPRGAAAITKHAHAPVVSFTKLRLADKKISRINASPASDVRVTSLLYVLWTLPCVLFY